MQTYFYSSISKSINTSSSSYSPLRINRRVDLHLNSNHYSYSLNKNNNLLLCIEREINNHKNVAPTNKLNASSTTMINGKRRFGFPSFLSLRNFSTSKKNNNNNERRKSMEGGKKEEKKKNKEEKEEEEEDEIIAFSHKPFGRRAKDLNILVGESKGKKKPPPSKTSQEGKEVSASSSDSPSDGKERQIEEEGERTLTESKEGEEGEKGPPPDEWTATKYFSRKNENVSKFFEAEDRTVIDYGDPFKRDLNWETDQIERILKEKTKREDEKGVFINDDVEVLNDLVKKVNQFERIVIEKEKRISAKGAPKTLLDEKYFKNEPTIRYGKYVPFTPLGPLADQSNHWKTSSNTKKNRRLIPTVLRWLIYGLILLILLAYFSPERYNQIEEFVEFRVKTGWRFLRCAYTAARIAYDYKNALASIEALGNEVTEVEKERLLSEAHSESAQLLLKLFEKNEGIFIKAGQHMSALGYIIPKEYTTAMEPLFEKAPYKNFKDIEKIFKLEFGATPFEMFEHFDTKPTSSASMAQVHKAKYKGRDVAVKVQHSGLAEQCSSDVKTIEILINIMAWIFPEFKLKWLVDEFNRNLPNELDFVQEARNAVKAQRNFDLSGLKRAKTPEIIWERTTAKVLCMEWIEGCSLYNQSKIRQMGISTDKVARLLTEIFNDQIFKHGFVHCDPHPGNVFVRKTYRGFELVLLDNGLYRQYDNEFRLDYANLWWSIYNCNAEGIKHFTRKLAKTDSYELFASMLTSRALNRETLAGSFKNYANIHQKARGRAEMAQMQRAGAGRIVEISQILQTVPPELLLLFKTNDLLRSVTSTLVSPEASFKVLSNTMEYCLWTIHKDELSHNGSLTNRIIAFWQECILSFKLRSYGLFSSWWLTSYLISKN
eukprot:TRINITY_DN324_c2_g1_i1.p1 TRINITY_DN324_c2_g1~~TRINITY_DN324_c2_g1_i1.p1  ORF type:complete len:886 (-),score=183.06 TRINITY_DN324_c2_g1_i1:1581-4238(-)